jgi:hypothetical protein
LLTVTKKFNSEMRGTTNQVYQIWSPQHV